MSTAMIEKRLLLAAMEVARDRLTGTTNTYHNKLLLDAARAFVVARNDTTSDPLRTGRDSDAVERGWPDPEFPDGYRAELTDEHDGTGGVYVKLIGPDEHGLGRFSGGGWDRTPFYRAASYAQAYDRGRRSVSDELVRAD